MSDRPHPYAPAQPDPLYDHQLEDLRKNFRAGLYWGAFIGATVANVIWLLVEVL